MDIAKRLLDHGSMAPTVYFPALVEEALMIEPTETETKETLDRFADNILRIAEEDPEVVKASPHNTSVRRVDEVRAAKDLVLSYLQLKRRLAKDLGGMKVKDDGKSCSFCATLIGTDGQ